MKVLTHGAVLCCSGGGGGDEELFDDDYDEGADVIKRRGLKHTAAAAGACLHICVVGNGG